MGRTVSKAKIFLDCKKLATVVFIATQEFPKGVKYTLGGEMHRAAILMMRAVAQAYNSHSNEEKRNALEMFQTNLDLVEGLLDISITQQWLKSRDVRNTIYPLIEAVSKQSSGWKRSVVASCMKPNGQNPQGYDQTESPFPPN